MFLGTQPEDMLPSCWFSFGFGGEAVHGNVNIASVLDELDEHEESYKAHDDKLVTFLLFCVKKSSIHLAVDFLGRAFWAGLKKTLPNT